jgi:hypothetical protein
MEISSVIVEQICHCAMIHEIREAIDEECSTCATHPFAKRLRPDPTVPKHEGWADVMAGSTISGSAAISNRVRQLQ